MSLNLHDCKGTSSPLAPSFYYARSGKKEKMINSVTNYSRFPYKILRRELRRERAREEGTMSQRWLQRSQSNATFEFGCLQFAFFFVKLEHKKIDDYLKVILLQAGCRNCGSLSINLELVSVNNTHGTVPALISEQSLPNKAVQNSGPESKQAFLIIVQVPVISWWLRTGYVICITLLHTSGSGLAIGWVDGTDWSCASCHSAVQPV